MKKYLLTMCENSDIITEVKCIGFFDTFETAFEHMSREHALYCLANGVEFDSKPKNATSIHIGGKNWQIQPVEFELTHQEKVNIFYEMQKYYDLQDIDSLITDATAGMGEVEIEAVILGQDDREEIQKSFRNHYEWDRAWESSLTWEINHYLNDRVLSEPSTFNVYFVNDELLNAPCEGFDQTQFDNVTSLKELGALWIEFADENHIPVYKVTGYENIGRTFNE